MKDDKDMMDNTMYTGEEEIRDYEYEDEFEKKIKRRRRIGISILVALLLLVIFLFLKACFTDTDIVEVSDNEKNLLKAGKEYFNTHYDSMPTEPGQCKKVTLNTLILEGFIKKKNYVNCGGKDTYVQVCTLKNKKKQWTPVLSCDEIKTYFDSWQLGDEGNLVKDQSDVKFKYLGQKVDISEASLATAEEYWQDKIPYSAYKTLETTVYYRTRTKLSVWNLNKAVYYPGTGYYKTSPGSGYTHKSSGRTVYKWYKATQVKKNVYSQKTWIEQGKPRETKAYDVYVCESNDGSRPKYSFTPCSNGAVQTDQYKACSSVVEEPSGVCKKCDTGKLNTEKTSCGYTGWKEISGTCVVGDDCKVTTQTITKKTYYPSGATSASREKTYYPASPAKGYTNRDSATIAYKWYKLVKTGTTSVASNVAPNKYATRSDTAGWGPWSKWSTTKPKASSSYQVETRNKIKLQQYENISSEDWKDVTNGYVGLKTLLSAFNKENINVTELKDINSNGQIRYKLKMYYRNRVEGGNE